MSVSLWSDEQERPAQHLRVLDLTVMLPGPYLTRLLAQYGADVVKVEHLPHGDPTRLLKNTALFELLNQGKRSVGINLKTPPGIELVKELAAEADIFVENFRQGVMDRMGLGYSELSEDNPDLLYLSLRGFAGKNAGLAAHDLNLIASSGVGDWYLESGSPNYSTHFGDMIGGVFTALIKLLFHMGNPARRGMHLISHMDEGFRSLYLPRAYDVYKAETLDPEKRAQFGFFRDFDGTKPHSKFYQCRDKQWISLNAVQQKHWDTFCEVVDRKNWKDRREDPALVPELEALFQDAPSTYWEALTVNRETCLFRVIPWDEHMALSTARPMLATDPLSWAGFAPNPSLSTCPPLGRDTYSVIHALGYSNKEIGEWLSQGTVFQPAAATT